MHLGRTLAISTIAFLLLIVSSAAETNSSKELLELARARFKGELLPLLPSEESLFTAVANGEPKNYNDPSGKDNDPANADNWASDRVLRASRIAWLCTDRRAAALVTYRGLAVTGARIDEKLDLDFARVLFPLRFLNCGFTEILSLTRARLLFLDLGGSYLRGLQADYAQIERGLSLNNHFKADGEVWLFGATIHEDLNCDSGILVGHAGSALSCDGAKITGNVFLTYVKAEGVVRLVGATIGENFDCDRGIFGHEGVALSCDGAKITGNVFLKHVKAEGEVRLIGATIGGDLICEGGQFKHKALSVGREALSVDRANINGGVFLTNNFKAEGTAVFTATNVVGYFYWKDVNEPELAVLDLRSAKVGTLLDDPKSWPREAKLDVFVYDRIDENPPLDADSRVKWLRGHPSGHFLPQPYEQLAAVLRKMGLDEDARDVMIAKNQEHARYVQWRPEWLWYGFFGHLIGYGYSPWTAFGISLIVIVFGWWLFQRGYRRGLVTPTGDAEYAIQKDGAHVFSHDYPKFNSFVYSLETFVPLVKLGIAEHWEPNGRCRALGVKKLPPMTGGWLRGYLWLHMIAGWLLSALWVGGITGLVKT